jgi:alpha-amylase
VVVRIVPFAAPLLVSVPALVFGCSADPADAVRPTSSGGAGGGPADGSGGSDSDTDGGAVLGGGAFVHLFEWKWTDVAKECETFLGPKGFAAVQVSPPSEHAVLGSSGYPWWQRYQTVGYSLDESRSGTRGEFEDMVRRCAAARVDIYVDAVVNHMTAQATGVGSDGTTYTKYEYPGLYAAADFHTPCVIADADYATDAGRVQTCELLGLADLNTGAEKVRSRIGAYLTELAEIGVRGFRIDAAKHMAAADLDAIVAHVAASVGPSKTPYFFFEVIDYGGAEAVRASDYLDVGRAHGFAVGITNFAYSAIGDHFLNVGGQKVADLRAATATASEIVPSRQAVVFTNNHDTQRASAISYRESPYYDLANVFLLAWPYGYPSIMSSYAFDRMTSAGRAAGPPSDGFGHTTNVYPPSGDVPNCSATPSTTPAGSWVCEHRARSAANMVAFRRAVADAASITNWWDNGSNQIAFGRGNKGFVVINREAAALSRTFETGMPQGSYCDVIAGNFSGGTCTGVPISIAANGAAVITVAANGAAAIHVGARLE